MIQIYWDFGDYADAYRSAARYLVAASQSKVELNAPLFDAHLALPTVYLYRHALELALKDAIIWSEIMISENSTMELRRSIDEVRGELQGHRLRPLYDRLIDRYSLVDSTGESVKPLGLREAIEPAVAAAETLDADGQRLRYPYISRGLEPSWSMERLSPNQTRVAEVSRTIEAATNSGPRRRRTQHPVPRCPRSDRRKPSR